MSLRELYQATVRKTLQEQYHYSSVMQVPTLKKITLNMRVGDAVTDKKNLVSAQEALALIAGQKPVVTFARKSIAAFKIRKGFPIGCKVTLRRRAMWNFLDRLVKIALPRIRDFRGLSATAFDGFGNYSLGIAEFIIFPEIDFETVDRMRGLDICLTTSASNNDEARSLLSGLGFPFKKV